jgi:hypothetical protein
MKERRQKVTKGEMNSEEQRTTKERERWMQEKVD